MRFRERYTSPPRVETRSLLAVETRDRRWRRGCTDSDPAALRGIASSDHLPNLGTEREPGPVVGRTATASARPREPSPTADAACAPCCALVTAPIPP